MSPGPARSLSVVSDRRVDRRYPVSLALGYRAVNSNRVGVGLTLNMSSSGLCFSSGEALAPGTKLEISLEWPFALGGSCPLKMCITGRVLWNGPRRTAVKILRYEFRTRRQVVARTA